MHPVLVRGALCLSLAAFAGAACDKTTTTPTEPTAPTEVTEPPFTGTLTVNGGVTQPFAATTVGSVSAIVVSLEPNTADLSLSIGVALGTWTGVTCDQVLVNDNAGVGSGVAGYANAAGDLCARVYDVGKLTEPIVFNLTIKHY